MLNVPEQQFTRSMGKDCSSRGRTKNGMQFLKKYRSTIFFALFVALFNYLNWPVEPKMAEQGYASHEIVGMPEYFDTADPHLKVNVINLKCDLGGLGGSDGCAYFRNLVNTKIPAHITYFRMPTRLWYQYNVLYSIEQDGKVIVSPEQIHARFTRHYSDSLELTRKFILFLWMPCLALILFGDFSGFALYRQTYFIESRTKVNEQFSKIGIDEEDSQYVLKGGTATIVQDKESNGGYEDCSTEYHLTRFARNPHGEYFMLMFTVIGGEVSMILFKHMEQTNARIVLKDKYVPPRNVELA